MGDPEHLCARVAVCGSVEKVLEPFAHFRTVRLAAALRELLWGAGPSPRSGGLWYFRLVCGFLQNQEFLFRFFL